MANSYITQPELPEPFPDFPEVWRDEQTGLNIPKRTQDNLRWRLALVERAAKDEGFQREMAAACAESTLFYINAFAWTYKLHDFTDAGKKIPNPKPHVPFITWPVQDKVVTSIDNAIMGGEDLGIDKSREMGATWIILAALDKYFLFKPDSQILLLSRNEDFVDQAGNHKSLFWKVDYLHSRLPEWLCPPGVLRRGQKNRTHMHVHNELNGSAIDGEATTAHAARGDRRLAVMMDEFAAVQRGREMRTATADVSPCRIVNSTPIAGSEYCQWIDSGKIKVLRLPWWEHPEKGKGRYVVQDEITKKWTIRSPFYDIEDERRSAREMAQELDMDHLQSGELYFEPHIIEQHKALFARPPLYRCDIEFIDDMGKEGVRKMVAKKSSKAVKFCRRTRNGKLQWWGDLVDKRPDQSKTYTFGIDISRGQGASNSVISIRCNETGEKIGEWADANTPPYDLAEITMAIALWVGGRNPRRLPMLIWEMNGPGWDFGRLVVKEYKYPFYYKDAPTGRVTKTVSNKYGWHNSGGQKKEALLSQYRQMIAHGGIINHSEAALDEMFLYVYYENSGTIGPAFLVEESSSAKKTHGDRVMADALTLLLETPHQAGGESGPSPPKNSPAWRRQLHEVKKRQKRREWRKDFNFSTAGVG
jgi:hypothetical protein